MSARSGTLGFTFPLLKAILDGIVWYFARTYDSTQLVIPEAPSILVLRNNDLGDLLVITPIFEALRNVLPEARITAGVGDWSRACLENNPFVDDIVAVNAPWYNNFIKDRSIGAALNYICQSPESQALKESSFDIGIDVLGSYFGSLLLLKAGIPFRIGVSGYAGGETAMQRTISFDPSEHVGQSALRLVKQLGPVNLRECRPQIFLSSAETRMKFWTKPIHRRIVISPGAGVPEKCWPLNFFRQIVEMLTATQDVEIIIVGGENDSMAGERLAISSAVINLVGKLSLREAFSLISQAGLVLCNSSMAMHAAAAFSVPTIVVLGDRKTLASKHQKLWGYQDTCTTLGKDESHSGVYPPEDVLPFILESLHSNRKVRNPASHPDEV